MAVTNLEVAQQVVLDPIESIADRAGIPREALLPYGRHIAKVDLAYLGSIRSRPEGRLVLVTATTPTPAGEGKTTTTVGLSQDGSKASSRSQPPVLSDSR